MIKGFLAVLLMILVGMLASMSGTASAHILVVDRSTRIAAVFHTNPDDDPVAGEGSTLYFDIQDKNSQVRIPYNGYDLFVTDERGQQTKVAVQSAGSTAIADYTFPAQGLYQLSLKSQPQYDSFQKVSLDTSLRISRGIAAPIAGNAAAASTDKNSWAIFGLTGGLIVWAMLGIIFVNNRRDVLAQSKW